MELVQLIPGRDIGRCMRSITKSLLNSIQELKESHTHQSLSKVMSRLYKVVMNRVGGRVQMAHFQLAIFGAQSKVAGK